MSKVQETFVAVTSFLDRFEPFEFLTQMSMTYMFTPADQFASESDDIHIWARHLEFATGYYATRALPTHPCKSVDGFTLEKFKDLMDAYVTAVDTQLMMESISPGAKRDPFALTSAKIHSLHVRGDAYPYQFKRFAQAVYSPHDAWFLEHHGFTIKDALEIAETVTRELNDRFHIARESSKVEAKRLITERWKEWEDAGLTEEEATASAGVAIFFGGSKKLYHFDEVQIAAASGVAQERCAAFLARMSQKPPYRNPMFPHTFLDGEKALWDYNTTAERPFLTDGEAFWLISPHSIFETFYHTFYFDLMGDKAYKPTFEADRGRALEEIAAGYFRRIFPSSSVYLNPSYPNREEFADICVIFDGKVLIVQCKGKTLTRPAHIGADELALKIDVEKAIKNAVEQGVKGRRFLESIENPHLIADNKMLPVGRSTINEIVLVAVTFMPLHNMATRIRDVEDDLGLVHSEYPAWALSLGDLDVVTQICNSPAKLLHYLRRRLMLELGDISIHGDEMDLLGFYIDQGLWLKGKEFDGMDFVGVSGFSDPIDEYIFRRYMNGDDIPPPKTIRPDGFDEIASAIERLPMSHRTDCAITLLDFSGKASGQFIEIIRKAQDLTKSDCETHTCSMGGNNTIPGVSFVTAPSTLETHEFFDRVQGFGHIKKYAEKNHRWVALGWKEGTSSPIDIAFWLEYPFAPNEDMDQALKALMPSRSRR
jgi:hypothetical protein